jgi:hypothetical protein
MSDETSEVRTAQAEAAFDSEVEVMPNAEKLRFIPEAPDDTPSDTPTGA